MNARQARGICPEIRLVHVETIGVGGRDSGAQVSSSRNRETQKACLERYREASRAILAVFMRDAPRARLEKASIDEAYLDVTAMVEDELKANGGSDDWWRDISHASVIIGGHLCPDVESDRALTAGASIALALRRAVQQELSFTCSAGVALNKQVAKIASARNKPNKQTVVTAHGVADLMVSLPLKKVPNFGGKLGSKLEELGCTTAGDVQALGFPALRKHFGDDRARWIFAAVQGLDDEPVQPKSKPKSMMAAKSFSITGDLHVVQKWISILAEELADRLRNDVEQYNRRAKTLVLHHYGPRVAERSRSSPMPRTVGSPSASELSAAGLAIFKRIDGALPCSRLALAAVDFVDNPAAGSNTITRLFACRAGNPGNGGLPEKVADSTDGGQRPDPMAPSAATHTRGCGGNIEELSPHRPDSARKSERAASRGNLDTDCSSCLHEGEGNCGNAPSTMDVDECRQPTNSLVDAEITGTDENSQAVELCFGTDGAQAGSQELSGEEAQQSDSPQQFVDVGDFDVAEQERILRSIRARNNPSSRPSRGGRGVRGSLHGRIVKGKGGRGRQTMISAMFKKAAMDAGSRAHNGGRGT
eukprot:evm.model.scf_1286.6 EVM.evm.TU.scf_1286.6   scf_1286:35361-41600(-)